MNTYFFSFSLEYILGIDKLIHFFFLSFFLFLLFIKLNFQEYRRNGIRTLREADKYEMEKRRREKEQESRKRRQNNSYLYTSAPKRTGKARADRYAERHSEIGGASSSATSSSSSSSSSSTSAAVVPVARPRKRSRLGPLDVSDAPQADKLTEMELELCSTLRLLPAHYLVIRDTIVRESIRLGYLSAVDANALLNIDIRKTGRLYDFFVSAGWVTAPKEKRSSGSSSNKKKGKSK